MLHKSQLCIQLYSKLFKPTFLQPISLIFYFNIILPPVGTQVVCPYPILWLRFGVLLSPLPRKYSPWFSHHNTFMLNGKTKSRRFSLWKFHVLLSLLHPATHFSTLNPHYFLPIKGESFALIQKQLSYSTSHGSHQNLPAFSLYQECQYCMSTALSRYCQRYITSDSNCLTANAV